MKTFGEGKKTNHLNWSFHKEVREKRHELLTENWTSSAAIELVPNNGHTVVLLSRKIGWHSKVHSGFFFFFIVNFNDFKQTIKFKPMLDQYYIEIWVGCKIFTIHTKYHTISHNVSGLQSVWNQLKKESLFSIHLVSCWIVFLVILKWNFRPPI